MVAQIIPFGAPSVASFERHYGSDAPEHHKSAVLSTFCKNENCWNSRWSTPLDVWLEHCHDHLTDEERAAIHEDYRLKEQSVVRYDASDGTYRCIDCDGVECECPPGGND